LLQQATTWHIARAVCALCAHANAAAVGWVGDEYVVVAARMMVRCR
jgi:hypothetical protein